MLDPDRYWDCLDQALQASSGGRVEDALAWLDEALRANPNGAEAHNGRGEILWDNGHHEEALSEFSQAVSTSPDLYPAQLNQVEILIEEFHEYDRALDLCDELLGNSIEPGMEAEVYYLKAKALFYCDDLDGAYFLLRRAIKIQDDVAVYRGFEGQILFELGRFEEARRSLEQAQALEPDSAHTVYHLALVLEHLGEEGESRRYFTKASHVAPDVYPLPLQIDPREFEAAVAEAVAGLPAEVRRYIRPCPILIEELPSSELIRREKVSPQVLGLFEGVPSTEPGASPTLGTSQRVDTDCITLFKRNLEKVAMSRAELIGQIQVTVHHEIGHYLGLDEDDIERLGLG